MSDLICPHCKVVMNATQGVDESGLHEIKPGAGDYSLCAGCLSFLKFNERVELVAMDIADVAAMPDGERITLTKIRKVIEEGRGRSRAVPGSAPIDLEFIKACDGKLTQVLREYVLPKLQDVFGEDLEVVVVVKLRGNVGAYCGGKKMNTLKAAKLLSDGAKHMSDQLMRELND